MSRSGLLVLKFSNMQFSRGKLGNRKKSEIFSKLLNLIDIDQLAIKIHFLSKLRLEILIFGEFMSFPVFTDLQGH